MQLCRAEISNFRSIDDLTLQFDHGCQVLIGINESGKSNILRALHLLDQAISPNPTDIRIERHDEPQVKSGYVRFVFKLSPEEITQVYGYLRGHFCHDSLAAPLVAEGGVVRSLEEWCTSRTEVVYRVTFPTIARQLTTWSPRQSEELTDNWFRNRSSDSVSIPRDENSPITVPGRGFIRKRQGLELPDSAFEEATIDALVLVLVDVIVKIVTSKLPNCIFWKYADQYLLPSSIDVASFCASPDTCIPLKSMFELAGYEPGNLSSIITTAQSQGHHRYLQILEKTASAATVYIRNAWKDYKNVRIRLEPNGSTLSPVIVDDVVPLDMANRSDGFKRFVSFLLQVSAKVRTEELVNTLILVDEPEIALHPTGARNLMTELIEIGRSNTVVYSTHSIFMIDKNEIARHLVVEKKNEVTTTWRAEQSRIQDEEVLYSAIGYSIFESLKEQNVIFEGWKDKEIFRVVSEAMSKSSKPTKDRLAGIGLTFAEGAKDIKNVARFLQLAARPCLIISDADDAALQHRKAYQVPGAWGDWKTLQEVLPGASAITGEDLVTKAALVKRANKFRGAIKNLNALSEEYFNAGEATVSGLRRWLESSGLSGKPLAAAMSDLKNVIFDRIRRSEISDEAEQLVTFVLEHDFSA